MWDIFRTNKAPIWSKEGRPWCPECAEIEPILLHQLPYLPLTSVFVIVDVGTSDVWYDPENDFRTDHMVALTHIPTLMELPSYDRLVGDEIYVKTIRDFIEANDDEL